MRRKDGLPQNRPRAYGYGITWRNRPKPYFVKFKRNKRQIVVGSFATLAEAQAAAAEFLQTNQPKLIKNGTANDSPNLP